MRDIQCRLASLLRIVERHTVPNRPLYQLCCLPDHRAVQDARPIQAFAATERRDALFTPQALEDDPDLLLG